MTSTSPDWDTARPDQISRTRLPSLTGLRFVAALPVFAFHGYVTYVFTDHRIDTTYGKLVGPGGVGVSFFFILSGFVLAWSARTGDTVTRFWRRRLVKIFPNHAVMWAVSFLLIIVTGGVVLAREAVSNLLLVHAWVPDEKLFFSMDMPSWSLSCEALFYLSFPLLLQAVRRLPGAALWPAAVGLIAVVWCIPLVAEAVRGGGAMSAPVTVNEFWFIYIFPITRCCEFVLGIVLARVVRDGRWIGLPLWPATVLAVAGYVASLYVPYRFGLVAATVIPLALLIPAAAVADLTGSRSPWRSRVMVWLGEVSFAFYLVHQVVLNYGFHALGARPFGTGRTWGLVTGTLLLIAMLGVAVLGAWILHAAVERPMMRRFAGRRRPEPVSVPDAVEEVPVTP